MPLPCQGSRDATVRANRHGDAVCRYMLTNFPLRHAALSPDGDDVAVAGSRGLALYSRRSARWRLFGDVSQVLESREFSGSCHELLIDSQRAARV